jgi:hypothetical protein
MSIQINKDNPGLVAVHSLERLDLRDGTLMYFIALNVKQDTLISVSFGPETDDEEDA